MNISKAFYLLARPTKLFAYLRMQRQRNEFLRTLSRVSPANEAWSVRWPLREKIIEIDRRIKKLFIS